MKWDTKKKKTIQYLFHLSYAKTNEIFQNETTTRIFIKQIPKGIPLENFFFYRRKQRRNGIPSKKTMQYLPDLSYEETNKIFQNETTTGIRHFTEPINQ